MANTLSIGASGLQSAKTSMETTSHNIANVNTEGYTRKRVVQQTRNPLARDGLSRGTGVHVRDVRRVHDQQVERRLHLATTANGFFEERVRQLRQVENVFSDLEGGGLDRSLAEFHNAFRELANRPEDEAMRSIVRDKAGMVVRDFRRLAGTIEELRGVIDGRIENEVRKANELLEGIAKLNVRIVGMEAAGTEAGDLRDRRDRLIRRLSESFGVRVYDGDRGELNVIAHGVGELVSGGRARRLATGRAPPSGSVEVYFREGRAGSVSGKFASGRLGALVGARDGDLRTLAEGVDAIAFALARSVNAAHGRGYAARPVPTGPDGSALPADGRGPTTGIAFFREPAGVPGAAGSLALSDEVRADLSNIVTALAPNAPGDNRVALAIAGVQRERIVDEGRATLEEHYLGHVGRIGVAARRASLEAERAGGILAQIEGLKEGVSGVNLDEEAANMIRHQHAYEASAKVMRTAEEMLRTVLEIKG